jgi:isopentenyl diphosphate isomerase/L-lactate dehydrogenase-like FMN-dependent dehydrogenase
LSVTDSSHCPTLPHQAAPQQQVKLNFLFFCFSLANFKGIKATGVKSGSGSGISEYVKMLFDQSLTWDDVMWLKR